jgi:hypothetical protein
MPKNTQNKTDKIELRISPNDKEMIQLNAVKIGMSVSKFIIVSALGHELTANKTDRDIYKELIGIKRELNQIGNNLNQLTKTCHLSRQLGEPVSVNMQMIESIKALVDRGLEKIDRCLLAQTNNNLRDD